MSRSPQEFVGKLNKASNAVNGAHKPAVQAGANAARDVLARAPGAPHTVAKKPVRVTARMFGNDAVVRFQGPAHLVNNPTQAHDIYPRKFVGTRGTGRKAQRGAKLLGLFGVDAHARHGGVKLADGQVRSHVHHPGTHGKRFFQAGVPGAERAAIAAIRKQVVKEVAGAFR